MEQNNPLFGKKVSFNGDSICQGAGMKGGYGLIIATRNQMVYENIGIGGGSVTAELYYQSGKPRHCVCRTIENMSEDADYAILEGGVNEASLQVPIGTLTEGYEAELDDTTFAGAFESMCKQVIYRFAGKKYGYIFVHKMTPTFCSDDKVYGYYAVAKAALEKWGVPYCDLNISCPPFGLLPADDPLRLRFTYNGDGWHPNEEGYLKYYCDPIEAWMKNL